MKYKKIMLILITAIFLVSIAGVCASDVNYTIVTSEDNLEIDKTADDTIGVGEDTDLASSEENEILTEGEQTFANLNTTINGNADKDIYLNGNYKYSSGDDSFKNGIIIDRDVNIYGNGHTINGSGEARIFQVNGGNVVFYNITFINGNAGNYGFGGAINGNCKAINCTFKENHAYSGGAMSGGSAVNCTFTGNTAESSSGAMWYGSAVNCTFSGNSAEMGGGAMGGGSAVNCIFTGNSAVGGGAMGDGSAVNCIFSGNSAEWDGGAMRGGSAVNCTFSGNSAEWAGGAMSGGSAVNCTFSGNSAEDGGAMFDGSAVNCTFSGNSAEMVGGAMFYVCYLECYGQKDEYESCKELSLFFDVKDFTSTYNSNKEFIISLKSQNGNVIFIDVDVVIFKDDVVVRSYSSLSGDSLIFDLAVGNYTAELKITYPNLDPQPKNIAITINKATPKIEVTAKESTYPNAIVNVKTDVSGEYMVTVGDKTQIVTLEAGVAQDIAFTGLAANETGYAVNVTNMDIENCTKVFNDTSKAVVHKATPKIEVSASDVTYPSDVVVTVKSDVDGTCVVKVGDKNETGVLVAGVATDVNLGVFNVDTYVIIVEYVENANYTSAVNDTENVTVRKANSTLTVDNIVLDYGETTNVTAITEGATGITAKINDTNVTVVNNFTIPISGLAAGNYTLTVTTIPDGDHNPATKTVNITVNKAGTEITLSNETLYLKAGDIVSDLANLTPADAGDLTFQSSNDDIAIAADGTIYARVKGNVTVTVSFAGTDNYAAAESKTIMVYVTLKDASVSVENETLNLNVNEKYEFNPTANPSFLAVQYSSSNESVVTVTDYGLVRAVGEGTAIITLAVGNNQTYAINTTNVTVTVSLNDASISLNNSTLDLFIDDTFTIVATTTPAGLNVTYVQDDSGVYTVDSNGVVTALKTGTGNILVKVGGDGVYVENSTEIPVIVSKAPTEIAADPIAATYNANKDLVITLKDSNGNPIGGLNITVDFNGTKNYTTDTSGQVKIPTNGLAANIYDVLISFNGTDKYLNSSNTTTVSIYKESSRADTKPLTTDYNVHKYLVVGLKDNEGNPIRNADVSIEIHGVTYKCRSDDSGDARLIIRLNPGTYTAKITFDNVNYTGFTQYVTVIVKKLTPKLTAKKKTFKKSKKVKKYTVTLKANSKALAKVKLTLKVKGKTYKAKTNSKGKAVFKIKNLKKKGTFKAKIKFAGNTYYNAVTKTVKIKIK